MSDSSRDLSVELGDTEDQSVPTTEIDPSEHGQQLRDGYGRIRTLFKRNPERFATYRLRLNQARVAIPYDIYLTGVVKKAFIAALAGLVVGISIGSFGVWADWLGYSWVMLLGMILSVTTGVAVGGILYFQPIWEARRRAAQIERLLPHGIAYLYALSQGGLSVFEAIRALAESSEEYGPLAKELDSAVIDMEYLGASPLGALQSLRERTYSDSLAIFLDGLTGTIDAGGDVTAFLSAQSEDYFSNIEREQDAFLEEVSLYAELYVGLLVVGPIFGVIVLVVVAIAGGASILPLLGLVYLGVPVLTIAFLWLTRELTRPFNMVYGGKSTVSDSRTVPESIKDDTRLKSYLDQRGRGRLQRLREQPVEWFQRHPLRSLVVSVPIALLVVAIGLQTEWGSLAALQEAPVAGTAVLGVLPLLIIGVPVAVVHELNVRRERQIARTFPNAMSQLSSANQQGLTIAEGLSVVARRTGGPLGDELKRTANDVTWGAGIAEAFDGLRDRIQLDSVGRTVALLTDASRYSGNLYRVIDIAARDTNNAQQLVESRRSETGTYVSIVLISFGLYLFMLVVLDAFFIDRIAAVPTADLPPGVGQEFLIGEVEPELYRTVLLHAALIQGIGSGLIAGELGQESWMSGLKYSIGLVVVAMLVFVGLEVGLI